VSEPLAFPRYPDHSRLLEVRDDEGNVRPVRTADDWAVRRRHILEGMQHVMGRLPTDRAPLDVRVLRSDDAGRYARLKIDYQAAPGDRVPAYLLVPKRIEGGAPAALCLHQTTAIGKDEPAGLGGRPTLHYAHELAERGYVCLVPDYPSLGEYAYDFEADPHPSGTIKGVWNHVRGVDLLSMDDRVDPERIGAIGHSLGGHNAMFLAAFDERVRAVVSCCGFTSFCRYFGGDLRGWSGPRYMPRILSYGGCDKVPFDFPEIVASFAPRAFLAVAPLGDDNFDHRGVRESMDAAADVYRLLKAPERLAARYPDSGHDFPDQDRRAAYEFLDRWLQEPT
jgi:pimeloyl-ACP methyl ester carboxylesterase